MASLDAAIDKDTDPVTVACTVNPATARVFRVGDLVVFKDEAADPDNPGRRSYECAQIVGPGSEGDVAPSGNLQFHRKLADDERPARASFETLRRPHAKGIRFFKLDSKTFTFSVKKGFFRTPGLPSRVEVKIPSVCVVAAVVGVANRAYRKDMFSAQERSNNIGVSGTPLHEAGWLLFLRWSTAAPAVVNGRR